MKNYPLIKFVLLFIIGFMLDIIFNFSTNILLIITAAIIIFSILLYFVKINDSQIFLLNLFVPLSVILSGALLFSINYDELPGYPFEVLKIKKAVVYGEVVDIDLKQDPKISFVISADSLHTEDTGYKFNGNIKASIYDDNGKLAALYENLEIGNYISLDGNLQRGRKTRNPGEFDYYEYLQRENIIAVFTSYDIYDLQLITKNTEFIKNTVFQIRKSIDNQIRSIHNDQTYSLLRGLILADRSEIDYETRTQFVNSGVIHVLAVSGLHVGYIVLIFIFLFNRTNVIMRYVLTIIGLIFFVVITGSPPSVVRASIMAIILILAFLSNRSYNPVNSLSLAALIILVLNPIEITNPGFQLSFSAVLSIVIFYPRFQKIINCYSLPVLIEKLLLFMSVSLAAQIGTLPFTLFYFHKLSIIALFANLLVIPLIGIIVSIGILTLTVSTVSMWLASIYGSANMLFSKLLFAFVGLTGASEFSYLYFPNFTTYDTLIYYIFLTMLVALIPLIKKRNLKIILSMLIIISFSFTIQFDDQKLLPDGKLSILIIDVGQGDGILIKFPDGKTALIDAGNATEYFDVGERTIKPILKNLSIDKVDYGFVSHLDADHYKGFESLIKSNLIDTIYKPMLDTAMKKDIKFENLIKENNIPIKYYSKMKFKRGNCNIYCLNDTTDYETKEFDPNNNSGILKLVHGENTYLFIGDVEHEAEKWLVSVYGNFLKAGILKVGHHGSKTSSGDRFLKLVNPNYALISAGIANKFNHPSESVVEKFINHDVKIMRTDKQGALLFISDGISLIEKSWLN
ncbi:MAG: DNA internalization-related competence protein ComEC/Rec2 [Melioribacteraceae bacterium]|nr:DNA internalization-related competence protein ComEC/Rec2 [Melioribacteraceae bacterium]MCF8354420.1 DNA internalization-related competence protein ComEC/Rec2 [Melioribacteraceae bacterium]MCF8392983.1 DNA internalization-related competence protein ComEC/Rec2 [Melioribacteraceae bacterium]MCF8417274.1 DNA internalization-related competence protein ComEC/Rec2 [Melioribacteraceae bacterium]